LSPPSGTAATVTVAATAQKTLGGGSRSSVLWLAIVTTLVAYIAAAMALGTTPSATASGASVASWFRANATHVRWWMWFQTVWLVAFSVIAAHIRARLPGLYRDVFFIGAIVLVAETAVQGWIWTGLAWHADALEPATARTVLDVASYWGPVLISATVLMLAPVTVLALRRRAGLPAWLGVVTGIALVEQLVETITIFGNTGFTGPGGPMNLLLGPALTILGLGGTAIITALTTAP
jgi:hypothetical protein